MRLPKSLRAAINTYYAFKNKNGDGMFSNEEKQACLKALDSAAIKHGIGLCVVPGTIFLVRGKQKAQINGPVLL